VDALVVITVVDGSPAHHGAAHHSAAANADENLEPPLLSLVERRIQRGRRIS
jgi:hypothetical protein